MGRFLFGVLFAFGLWWGYDRFLGSDAKAGEPAGQDATRFAAVGAGDPVPPGPGTDPGSEPGRQPPELGTGGSDAIDPSALNGFAADGNLSGAERDRAVAERVRAVRAAATAAAGIEALGADNGFLHVAEGRAVAVELQARIEAMPRWDAVRASTGLLEAAMRGPIERGHAEARAAFDGLVARHMRLVQQTVFDPADATGARRYEVQGGDNLIGIASHLRKTLGANVESGTLQIINRISDPRSLQVGQALKCPVEPIHTVVHKASFVVAVYVGDVLVRAYWCAHGKPNQGDEETETPVATFVVGKKIENPDWHFHGRVVAFGDPENPLGTRFVGFEHPTYQSLGIHGTNDPSSIGTLASLGCIRLAERDILEYFRLVPRRSEVQIVP